MNRYTRKNILLLNGTWWKKNKDIRIWGFYQMKNDHLAFLISLPF